MKWTVIKRATNEIEAGIDGRHGIEGTRQRETELEESGLSA